MFEYPTAATGVVIHRYAVTDEYPADPGAAVSPDGRWAAEVTGSAFSILTPRHFATAAHCVGHVDVESLSIFTLATQPQAVDTVYRHPNADLAVVELSTPSGCEAMGVSHFAVAPGEEFRAVGYPVDVVSPEAEFNGRIVAGHHQRIIREYISFNGFRYQACEMSVPPPAGLSGGPIFRPSDPSDAVGLVAERLDSSTELRTIEEVREPGHSRTIETQRIVSFGIGVLLEPVVDWLDSVIGVH
jgi:hypothetical protein